MKKIAVLLTCVVLLLSCKQQFENNNAEHGTVVIDLSSHTNLRKIGNNGLPELASSKMKIIVKEGASRPIEMDYNEGAEKKYSAQFPVGSTIKCTVIVMNKSGQWKGEAVHTVQKGENRLSVKLSKSAFSLQALKFNLYKNIKGQGELYFSLGFEGATPFFREGVNRAFYEKQDSGTDYMRYTVPAFCRDRLGRTYVFYQTASYVTAEYVIKRYTSEGEEDASFTSKNIPITNPEYLGIVADRTNNNVFAIWGKSGEQSKMALVRNDGLKDTIGIPMRYSKITAVAVHNNIFAIAEKGNGTKLALYAYKNGALTALNQEADKLDIEDMMKAEIESSEGKANNAAGDVKDLFIKDGSIYVLYDLRGGTRYTAFGGILKCPYSVQGESATFGRATKLVGKNEYKAKEKVANVTDEKSEFYGALKFVGFNEKELYIADDGVSYEYDAGVLNITQNKNRLISLNMKEEKIKVKTETETWLPEIEAINKNINPTLFYSAKEEAESKKSYDVYIHLGTENGIESESVFNTKVEQTKTFKHVFDSSSNLYVLTDEGLAKYLNKGGSAYNKDYNFMANTAVGTKWRKVLYDVARKELYLESDNGEIHRYYNNEVEKLQSESLRLSSKQYVIYNGKLYIYSNGNFDIHEIKKDQINRTKMDSITTNVKEDYGKIKALFAHDDTLFVSYLKNDDFSTHIMAINHLQNTNKTIKDEKVYGSDEGLSSAKDCIPVGYNKKNKKVHFLVDLYTTDYDGRVSKNINKYLTVKVTNSGIEKELSDVPQDITWEKEWKKWVPTKKLMLFNVEEDVINKKEQTNFYAVERANINNALPSSASIESSTSGAEEKRVYNNFCYDQLGNLYVLYKKANDYYILRFKLGDDGGYNFDAINTDFDKIAIKLDNSMAGDLEPKSFLMAVYYREKENDFMLYYSFRDNPNNLELKAFQFYDYDLANPNHQDWHLHTSETGMSLANDWKVKKSFLKLTANKDGVFLAVKETETKKFDTPPVNIDVERAYNIKVLKFHPSNTPNYDSPLKSIDVVGSSGKRVDTKMFTSYEDSDIETEEKHSWDEYTQEFVGDMYAYKGTLYALTYKKIGAKDYQGAGNIINFDKKHNRTYSNGSVLKIGNNTKEFTDNAQVLYSSEKESVETSGKFCPQRFIGVLDNELAIASDGFYGYKIDDLSSQDHGKLKGKNFDNVLFLDLNDDTNKAPESKETTARFSFKLTEVPYSDYDWQWE